MKTISDQAFQVAKTSLQLSLARVTLDAIKAVNDNKNEKYVELMAAANLLKEVSKELRIVELDSAGCQVIEWTPEHAATLKRLCGRQA